MREKVAVWGAGGHALVVSDILSCQEKYDVVAFIDNQCSQLRKKTFCGSPVIGSEEDIERLLHTGVNKIVIAVGKCKERLSLAEHAKELGFSLVSAIHPRAVIASGSFIGVGTIVAAGAVINPGTEIGQNVIINTSSSIDHECVVADGATICPGVHLAGNVLIERRAWIGIGATVIERVRIGEGAFIGAGAVVIRDIPAGAVAYGVPARTHDRTDSL